MGYSFQFDVQLMNDHLLDLRYKGKRKTLSSKSSQIEEVQ